METISKTRLIKLKQVRRQDNLLLVKTQDIFGGKTSCCPKKTNVTEILGYKVMHIMMNNSHGSTIRSTCWYLTSS